MLYNGIIDYLSLGLTRAIIKSRWSVLLKIEVGIIATAIIVYTLFFLTIVLLTYSGLSLALDTPDTKSGAAIFMPFLLLIVQFAHFPPKMGTVAFVVFATSFSTLIWLLLHVLSIGIIKVVPPVFSALNVQNKPVRAIGLVSAALVWAFGIPTAVFYFVTR